MKKGIFLLLPFVLFSAEIVRENEVLKSKFMENLKRQNKVIVKMAAEDIATHLPQKVDKFTTMVGVDHNGANLIYIYELNVSGKSDNDLIKEGRERMTSQLKESSCVSAKRFLQSDITLSYVYKSAKSKKTLFKVDVDKRDCKKIWRE